MCFKLKQETQTMQEASAKNSTEEIEVSVLRTKTGKKKSGM
jgi:hypothetical protein